MPHLGQAVRVSVVYTSLGVPKVDFSTPPTLTNVIEPSGAEVSGAAFTAIEATFAAGVKGYDLTLPESVTDVYGEGTYEFFYSCADTLADYDQTRVTVEMETALSAADVWAYGSRTLTQTTGGLTYVNPYEQASGTITIGYGADYLEDSPLGLIRIAANVPGIDLTTADAVLKFSVKHKSDGSGITPKFTVTGDDGEDLNHANILAFDATHADLALTTTETTRLSAAANGRYVWDCFMVLDGVDTPFAHGTYSVENTVTLPTVNP